MHDTLTKRKLPPLKRLFAVTKNNEVWIVTTWKFMTAWPLVWNRDSKRKLRHGTHVSVNAKWLGLYFARSWPTKNLNIRRLQTAEEAERLEGKDTEIGEKTSEIMGYFLRLKDAKAASRGEMESYDIEMATIETLTRIGPSHPVFVISRDSPLAFPSFFYEKAGIVQSLGPEVTRVALGLSKPRQRQGKRDFHGPRSPIRIPEVEEPEEDEPEEEIPKGVILKEEDWTFKASRTAIRIDGGDEKTIRPASITAGKHRMILIKFLGEEWWVKKSGYPRKMVGARRGSLEQWDEAKIKVLQLMGVPPHRFIKREPVGQPT